jgi:hypothetical protein
MATNASGGSGAGRIPLARLATEFDARRRRGKQRPAE